MADIWERKIRTHFRRKDIDNDGKITRKDFLSMAEKFADAERFETSQKEATVKCLDHIFSLYVRASEENDDVLTEDLLVESLKSQRDDAELKKRLRDWVNSILGPMDVNTDGYLDAEEYRKIFENVGIVESDFTKAAFEAIDTNRDGKLSFGEFEVALIDYLCSDADDSVSMFGLVGL